MKGFDKTPEGINDKWSRRFNATKAISKHIQNYIKESVNGFSEWHKNVIEAMISEYSPSKLTEGQAQKWLNMTIKYLYVFSNIIDEQDSRIDQFRDFIVNSSTSEYYPPVDSYILKQLKKEKIDGIPSKVWSQMDHNESMTLRDLMIQNGKDFIWELQNWKQFADKYADIDSRSYAAYLREIKK